jgi:hypothetical protein
MKIWLNFDHSKVPNYTLAMIFEGIFSRKVYYLMLHHMLSHCNNLDLLFSTVVLYCLVHIFVFQKSLVKSGFIYIEKNYIYIFIIKFVMYN